MTTVGTPPHRKARPGINTELPGQDGFGHWRKSSYNEPNGNDCVEVAFGQVAVGLRDSKNPDGPHLTFDRTHLLTFVTTARKTTT